VTTSSTLPTLPTLCPVSRMGAVTGQPTFSSLNKLEAISHVLVLSAHHWAGPKHRTKKKRKRNSRPLSSGHRCKFSHVPCLCVCVCVHREETDYIHPARNVSHVHILYARLSLFLLYLSPKVQLLQRPGKKSPKRGSPVTV
jgi:hypothetical protein